MAIDPVNDHVFVSSTGNYGDVLSPGTASVEVLDFSGKILDTISGFGSDNPYVVTTDHDNSIIYAGDAIYMTDTEAGTIDRIDPSTFALTVLTSGLFDPTDLVYSAGYLWTASDSPGTLLRVDMTTGAITNYPKMLIGSGLASGAGLPDTIFSYDVEDSPLDINEINVGSTPTVENQVFDDGPGPDIENVNDVVVSPDGSHLYLSNYVGPDELNTSNLMASGTTFPLQASGFTYSNNAALAVSGADGGLFAGGYSGSIISAPSLIGVYPLDSPSDLVGSYVLTGDPLPRGISFSPDGTLLFVVAQPSGPTSGKQFEVINTPSVNQSSPQGGGSPPPNGGGSPPPQATKFTMSVNGSASATIAEAASTMFSESGLPSTARGSVSFAVNGVDICTLTLSGLANESTGCSGNVSLPAGTYSIIATFSDTDGDFQDSTSSNSATLRVNQMPSPTSPPPGPTGPTSTPDPVAPSVKRGYDLVGSDGGVFVFNPAGVTGGFYGSLPGLGLHVNDIVGIVPTANDLGYYLVGSDGGVFAFGDAPFYGSLPGAAIHVHDIVGIVPTGNNEGYYLVGADGGVFTFGNARFLGSLPGEHIHLNSVVGIAATANGGGYWVVTSNGQVYNFGDAVAYGGTNAAVTAVSASPDGDGYWLVGSDGGVFAFGAAAFEGSLPGEGTKVNNIVGLVPSGDGNGYLLFGSDGGIFTFGDATFAGSLPGIGVRVHDIVGASSI
jgi:hypothetical protein